MQLSISFACILASGVTGERSVEWKLVPKSNNKSNKVGTTSRRTNAGWAPKEDWNNVGNSNSASSNDDNFPLFGLMKPRPSIRWTDSDVKPQPRMGNIDVSTLVRCADGDHNMTDPNHDPCLPWNTTEIVITDVVSVSSC